MEHFLQGCGGSANLLPGMAKDKLTRNTSYLMSLSTDNLLLPFRVEAGLYSVLAKKTDFHWGWDSPLSFLRGTFTGHWLSAAAQICAQTRDIQLRAKAEYIVTEIARCQKENGGRWAFGIPEKYLHWLRDGKRTWAPQYVCHKLMMGLHDLYKYLGNKEALQILLGCADWFYDFTNDISRDKMDDMMDFDETGGILELWADLYAITHDEKHLALIRRYERPRLYEPLLAGVDVLTNMHANTTIPEICGVARAYEATGDERYREIAEKYWELAVDKRGTFVTGGQTNGEVWTPPFRQFARLSDRNQEHCTVYHMMRLGMYLFAWTGDTKYADYWEQNLYNGIFAQSYWEDTLDQKADEDHPAKKGHLAYYLPLAAGSHINWGAEQDHFWCCHCTAVQSNANFHEHIFFRDGNEIYIAQYLPAELKIQIDGADVTIRQETDSQSGKNLGYYAVDREIQQRPKQNVMSYQVCGGKKEFTLKFRLPWWLADEAQVYINGSKAQYETVQGHAAVTREWNEDTVKLVLPKKLQSFPLADKPDYAAFIDGPIALAGLCGEARTLIGDIDHPESFLFPDNERFWNQWRQGYQTAGQAVNIQFIPVYDIGYKTYTVYFPIQPKP